MREKRERKRKREWRQREIRRREEERCRKTRNVREVENGLPITNYKLTTRLLLGRKLGRDFLSHHEKNVLESKLHEEIRMRCYNYDKDNEKDNFIGIFTLFIFICI